MFVMYIAGQIEWSYFLGSLLIISSFPIGVSQIQTITNKMKWHYVPTNLNPTGILSRGPSPKELLNSTLWSNGPDSVS